MKIFVKTSLENTITLLVTVITTMGRWNKGNLILHLIRSKIKSYASARVDGLGEIPAGTYWKPFH